MSTRNFPGGKKRPARRLDNLADMYEPNVSMVSHTSTATMFLASGSRSLSRKYFHAMT
jgi:hypothetical protein